MPDVQGSTRVLIDGSNAVLGTYHYSAFGTLTTQSSTPQTRYLYTGQQYDSTTKLYSLRARSYSPTIGRFFSQDTYPYNFENPLEINRYVYGINNPVRYADPSGMVSLFETAQLIHDNVSRGVREAGGVGAYVHFQLTQVYVRLMFAMARVPFEVCIFAEAVGIPVTMFNCGAEGRSLIRNLFNSIKNYASKFVDGARSGSFRLPNVNLKFNFCSFDADTPVKTKDGDVPIADIRVGDMVLAYNEVTDAIEEHMVTATFNHLDPILVELVIDGETVTTTPEHPFYTDEGEWVEAGELEIGDAIFSVSGEYGTVDSMTLVEETAVMYNLTVDEAHTFFVGEEGWLVHNACILPPNLEKLVAKILKKCPIESGKCSIAAQDIYDLLKSNQYTPQVGHMETQLPFLVTKDNTMLSRTVGSSLAYHDFVITDGTVFDALTGAKGMVWDEYLGLFHELDIPYITISYKP